MRITSLLIAAMLTATAPMVPLATYANAQSHDDSDRARNHLASGRTMSLREIEQLVLPKMRGMQYLGPEYFPRLIDTQRPVTLMSLSGHTKIHRPQTELRHLQAAVSQLHWL